MYCSPHCQVYFFCAEKTKKQNLKLLPALLVDFLTNFVGDDSLSIKMLNYLSIVML